MIFIIQKYGYRDFGTGPGSVIAQIVAINNLANADTLPGAGSVLLIPRPTATSVPENNATVVAQVSPNVPPPDESNMCQYVVQAGDTLLKIAGDYSMTLAQLAVLNPDLNVFGCNFEIPSGGPNCNPPLSVGQALNVLCPTPTPTLSPTPSGNETATPTPTFAAPLPVFPPDGATAPAGVFNLQWVSVGILQEEEFYLIEITDTTTGAIFRDVTKDTALQLPESLIPTDGETHKMQWTVRIASPNEQGVYRTISGVPILRTFYWQSR